MNKVKIILFFILILSCLQLFAAEKSVRMNASATDLFETDVFELEVVLNNFDATKVSVYPPDFEKYLKRIYGPSQSQSTSIINGDFSSSITLTYRFSPNKSGKLVIPPFVVKEDNKKYKSNSLSLNVVKQGGKISAKGKSAQSQPMFLRTIVSKTAPYLGEMIKVDYVLYLDPAAKIRMPSILELPKVKGVVKDDIELPKDKAGKLIQKIYKKKKYNTLLLKSMWLTASSVGEITLDPLVLSVPVAQKKSRKRRRSFFDDPFFGDDIYSGYARYEEKVIESNPVKLNVLGFPEEGRPTVFSGVVGNFTITSTLSADSLDVNDALILRTVIKGSGSLRDIKDVKYEIPDDFEVYDPKRTVKYNKNSKAGGKVTLEQVLIPRFPGEQKINGFNFTYFNPKTKKYVTVKGKDHLVKVGGAKGFKRKSFGSPSSYSQKEVLLTGEDIRYIKKGNFKFYAKKNREANFFNFYIYLLIAIFIPLVAYLINQLTSYGSNDISRRRSKKASAFAMKRLKKAVKYREQGDYKKFYKALEEAVYKYLADKFNISAAGIVIDLLAEELKGKNVADDTISLLGTVLNKTASIQFSPLEHGREEMESDLNKTKNLLLRLQDSLK